MQGNLCRTFSNLLSSISMTAPRPEDDPKEWEWLSRQLIETLHAESLSRFGGSPGMRDEGLLESARARPQHLARYEEPSSFI